MRSHGGWVEILSRHCGDSIVWFCFEIAELGGDAPNCDEQLLPTSDLENLPKFCCQKPSFSSGLLKFSKNPVF